MTVNLFAICCLYKTDLGEICQQRLKVAVDLDGLKTDYALQ